MGNKRGSYYKEDKYDSEVAETLKKLDNKVHYKLYMLYAKNVRITQETIANYMGVSRAQFSDYIRTSADKNNPIKPNVPNTLSLFRLCIALNIPLCYFLNNDIDYMENPVDCPSQENDGDYTETVNKELIPFLVNRIGLKADRLNEQRKIKAFLKDTGIEGSKFQYMTPAALESFTIYVREGLQGILSDKRNIIEPVNPIDPDDLEE